ncbi:MAG: hypothetical protein M4D80_07070 [Myxococcota bacterium]|nr:hypothetical protein [Myxococcota bacterium]
MTIESFVDLTYRGLALGRRIKLTQVRPTTGYLELPMPMPVGTQISISTDEGVTLEATVAEIHEQVGGSDRVPGMIVKPVLAADAASSWWQARVGLPEDERPDRGRSITVRPRTHTVPAPPPTGPEQQPLAKEVTETKELSVFVAEQPVVQIPTIDTPAVPLSKEVTSTKELSVYVAESSAPVSAPMAGSLADLAVPQYEEPPQRPKIKEEDIKRTTVMNAIDQELLAKLTSQDGEVEQLVRRTGEHDVVDDGLRTTVMDAVDPAALGLDVTASGSFRAHSGDEEEEGDASDSKPTGKTPSGVKKRKKRR